jgi:hypothetical protein
MNVKSDVESAAFVGIDRADAKQSTTSVYKLPPGSTRMGHRAAPPCGHSCSGALRQPCEDFEDARLVLLVTQARKDQVRLVQHDSCLIAVCLGVPVVVKYA